MVIVIRPFRNNVRCDLGGLSFETCDSVEEVFEYLQALAMPENRFVIQLPLPASDGEPFDLVGIVSAGRIQQFLCSVGAESSVLYEDSPFRE